MAKNKIVGSVKGPESLHTPWEDGCIVLVRISGTLKQEEA